MIELRGSWMSIALERERVIVVMVFLLEVCL